jgi:hypothetical protein
MTLSKHIQHISIECHYAECRYAECCDYLNVILSVIMVNVVMLSVVAHHFYVFIEISKVKYGYLKQIKNCGGQHSGGTLVSSSQGRGFDYSSHCW